MASLFKPTYSARDPKTGETKPRKARKWYGQFRDGDGILQRIPLSTDKTAAQQMLNALVRRAEMEKAGINDPFREHRARPLSAHLDDFEEAQRAKGSTAKQVDLVCKRVRRIVEACGFKFLSDLSASRVSVQLADFREAGIGAQTSNHYLGAIKQFCRWLVRDRRMAENPMGHLDGLNVKLDRRHDRRDLTEAELAALLEAARRSGPVRSLSGPDRAMLYDVAAYTGLRLAELASLTPESFDLERRIVTVAAGYSKRRREDVLPLNRGLADRLRPWLAARRPGEPLWPGKWPHQAVMVRCDLEPAGIARQDGAGRFVDFHSLRHTFTSRLARAGVTPKVAQALSRHSDINLTLNRYTHVGVHDLADAVDRLPDLPGPKPEPMKLRATGTDDTRPTIPAQIPCTDLAQTIDAGRSKLIVFDPTATVSGGAEESRPGRCNPRQGEAFEAVCGDMIANDRASDSGGGGIRTPGTLAGPTVFKTVPIDHSGTPPKGWIQPTSSRTSSAT